MHSTSGNAASFCAAPGKNAGGDIGEGVGVQAALEQRQHLRARPPVPRADFENAQSAAFRQTARGLLDGRGDRRQPVAGEKTVAVKLIEQLRAGAGEQHLHGVFFAAQNRAEFRAISRAEQCFGKMAGVLLDIVAQRFLGGIRRFDETGGRLKPVLLFRSKPRLTSPAINRSKTGRIGRGDTARVAALKGFFALTPISRSPCATCAAARSSRGGHRSLQFGAPADVENTI